MDTVGEKYTNRELGMWWRRPAQSYEPSEGILPKDVLKFWASAKVLEGVANSSSFNFINNLIETINQEYKLFGLIL